MMNRVPTAFVLVTALLLTTCITEHNYYNYLLPEPDGVEDVVEDGWSDSADGQVKLDAPDPETDLGTDGKDMGGDGFDQVDVEEVEIGIDVSELEIHEEDVCTPDCDGKECGDNGCGGTCGECGENQECDEGQCECTFKPCKDLCCLEDEVCFEASCCPPDCDESECGDDGCGGTCGECGENEQCVEGVCNCTFKPCEDVCCLEDEVCFEAACCMPACDGKECGDDGCGGLCGEEAQCEDGNPCTWDACDEGVCDNTLLPLAECVCDKDADCDSFDDDLFCNGTLHCAPSEEDPDVSLCQVDPETVPVVDDEFDCTIDECDDENDVVVNTPTDAECDDENDCTEDLCNPGEAGEESETGCVYSNVDDDTPCTDAPQGVCKDGACVCQPACEDKECGEDDGCGGSCDPCVYWVDPEAPLMWQSPPVSGKMDSSAAQSYCETLELGGFDDWHLPNITELRSLIRGCPATEYGGNCNIDVGVCLDTTCIDEASCQGCQSGIGPGPDGYYWPNELGADVESPGGEYWSSSAVTSDPGSLWYVHFLSAYVNDNTKGSHHQVRCVRGFCEPGADEVCDDNLDNNCDGDVDEGCCEPDCEGKECGDDGCGQSCGSCDDDNDACTIDDCEESTGQCNTPIDIDDNDPCTDDACDSGTGDITHVAKDYDDGLFCNGLETCDPITGKMLAGEAPVVDDMVGCTVDLCDEENDVVTHTPDDALCDNQKYCDGVETCDQVLDCQAGQAVVCKDNNGCTDDSCDEDADGCKYENNTTTCDDLDPCTEDDICADGACGGTEKDCSDQVECTINEACDAQGDCTFDLDHDFCDDGNECTDDVCDPDDGCLSTPVQDGGDCTLVDPCQKNPSCQAGVCTGEFDLENCGDFDHDGLMGDADLCPYAFDPGNPAVNDIQGADACEAIADHGDFEFQRELKLSEDGATSQWRRTHEPVEIPLANGIIDDSVVGYWKLDGDAVDVTGKQDGTTSQPAPVVSAGAFSDQNGALSFNGSGNFVDVGNIVFENDRSFAVLARFKTESPGGAIFGYSASGVGKLACHCNVGGKITGDFLDKDGANLPFSTVATTCDDGDWHSFAVVRNAQSNSLSLFVDGKLDLQIADTTTAKCSLNGLTIGAMRDGAPKDYFTGQIDEFLIFNRALSPDEVETYYRSGAPYGTNFVPGSQADFDDVRVTEKTGDGDGDGNGDEYVKRSRVIGPRPHSDTACPMDADDGTWAARDDLCGVVAYWPLDGDAVDVLGVHDGESLGGTEPSTGRFAQTSGAVSFDLKDEIELPANGLLIGPTWTLEMFVQPGDGFAQCTGGFQYLWLKDKTGVGANGDVMMNVDIEKNCTLRLLVYHDGAGHAIFSDVGKGYWRAGTWHHIAAVWSGTLLQMYVDGIVQDQTYELAAPVSVPENSQPLFLGAEGNLNESYFGGKMDEVIVHNVAKSADYIYHRANPGVPKLRFLANTQVPNAGDAQNPSYPLRDYKLYWGDKTAEVVVPLVKSLDEEKTCYGLLNECMGYAGWWRFNEGSGDVAVDSSTCANSGQLGGDAAWSAGREGTGVELDGNYDFVEVPGVKTSGTGSGATLEVLFFPVAIANYNNYILSKYKSYNSYLNANDGGAGNLAYEFNTSNGTCALGGKIGGEGAVPPVGAWSTIAATYDGSKGISYFGYEPDSIKDCSGQVNANENPLLIGHYLKSDSNGGFIGLLDSVRIMNRALETDEFLHFPLMDWEMGKVDCGQCGAGEECHLNPIDQAWKCMDNIVYEDSGDVALNGQSPNNGDSPLDFGWIENPQSVTDLVEYSSAVVKNGALAILTMGHNSAGAHFVIPDGTFNFDCTVNYSSPKAGSENSIYVRSDGDWSSFLRVKADKDTFKYGFGDSTGAFHVKAEIPGAPPFEADKWYELGFHLADGTAVISVSDGNQTGQIMLPIATIVPFDSVQLNTDLGGGGSPKAYWDDVVWSVFK